MPAIYLDNNATTRIAAEVADAMRPFLAAQFGNASSVHAMGQTARHAVETARESVASLIHAQPDRLAFTAGGTASDRLAISGLLAAAPEKRRIVTTAVEHAAVADYCRRLDATGYDVVRVGVNSQGELNLDEFADALSEDTALASVMLANNETGVIFPIRDVAELTAGRGIPLHCDAVQAAGRRAIHVESLGAQLVTLSAHKIHGPKGAGTLWIQPGTRFCCPFTGARTPRDLREGTENVPAIVGFGIAARMAAGGIDKMPQVASLRDRLEREILAANDNAVVAGRDAPRIANTSTICFDGLEAEAILIGLSERCVYVSSGSACSSGSIEPSHVLQAMGLSPGQTRGAIRFSLSRDTTKEETADAVSHVNEVVGRLRAFAVRP